MKVLLLLLASIVTVNATEAIVYLIGNKGDCTPATNVVCKLDLHGIDTVNVWANGSSVGTLKWPYQFTLASLPNGSTNSVVVVTTDFFRRTTTNSFELVSRVRTYNKRK